MIGVHVEAFELEGKRRRELLGCNCLRVAAPGPSDTLLLQDHGELRVFSSEGFERERVGVFQALAEGVKLVGIQVDARLIRFEYKVLLVVCELAVPRVRRVGRGVVVVVVTVWGEARLK